VLQRTAAAPPALDRILSLGAAAVGELVRASARAPLGGSCSNADGLLGLARAGVNNRRGIVEIVDFPEATMRVPKRLIALVGLLVFALAVLAGPHAGRRGKDPVEVTSALVELTPPEGEGLERKEVVLCWETAVDNGSVFAVNEGPTPPDQGEDKQARWDTFQVPGLAVEIDKQRTEELGRKLAEERVTVVALALTYHRKLQTGSWTFGVHSIPPRPGSLRLLGKVRVLIERSTATPLLPRGTRPGERSP
jgi:hypothetical protein